jgi:hypothetical protein
MMDEDDFRWPLIGWLRRRIKLELAGRVFQNGFADSVTFPQGLKPFHFVVIDGTTEVMP